MKFSVFLLLLVTTTSIFAQKGFITGNIINATTKEPVAFANVYFKKSLTGTVSDFNGDFSIKYNNSKDSLIISAIGYKHTSFYAPDIKQKKIKIKLKPSTIKIKEVKIKPKKTKAHELLRLIRKHEKENNTYYFKGIEGDIYNRTSIMFMKIDNKIKESRVFKKSQGAFIDDSDSTCSVPVLMSEDINHFLIPADGSKKINVKIKSQQKGLDIFNGADMSDITDEMTANQNFYKQFITLFAKNFASPVYFNARFYYKMWVRDSIVIDGLKRFKVEFRPKSTKDLAFYGYFWVEDSTFAITEIKVNLSAKANINYIRNIKIHNIYEKSLNKKWYFKKKQAEIVLNYTPGNDTLNKVLTYVSKVTIYDKIKKTNKNVLDSTNNTTKIKPKENDLYDNVFWEQNRFAQLNTKEKQIYASIDTLKSNPFIQVFDKSLNMFLTGYWGVGKIELGPYLDFYRHNKIEGHRVSFAMRTSELFNENYTIGGYIGYGFRDKKPKYGIEAKIKIPSQTYTVLSFNAWNDIRKIGHNTNLYLIRENTYSTSEDNIVSAVTARRPNDKLSKKQYASIGLEHDITKGVTTTFKIFASNTFEGPYVNFMHNNNHINNIYKYAASTNIRFSFKENYLNEYFKRVYLGNKYPIVNVNIEGGFTNTESIQRPYFRLHTTIKHKLHIGMGFLKYVIEAGKIFGEVPFPMLEIHRGNETYGYIRYNFNMLNNMEYASDIYVNLHSTYNLGGLILNYIPLIKRLNLREVISFKGILGNLSNKHASIIDYPTGMTKVVEPYGEIGIGLTNIGQYGRIEYVWRLSDLNKPGIATEGIRFRFEVSF